MSGWPLTDKIVGQMGCAHSYYLSNKTNFNSSPKNEGKSIRISKNRLLRDLMQRLRFTFDLISTVSGSGLNEFKYSNFG